MRRHLSVVAAAAVGPVVLIAAPLIVGSLVISLSAQSQTVQTPAPPRTAERPVTDEYFGRKVVHPYRWLENWDDPEVHAWTKTQNSYARAMLDAPPCSEAGREHERQLG